MLNEMLHNIKKCDYLNFHLNDYFSIDRSLLFNIKELVTHMHIFYA